MHTAERKGRRFFNKSKIRSGDWAIVLAESVVRRKGSIAVREFGIWVVTLKGVQNVAVLIHGVGGILVLADTHLEKRLGGSKEFDIKAIVHVIFKLLFDGIVATDVEHVVDEKIGGGAIGCVCCIGQNRTIRKKIG